MKFIIDVLGEYDIEINANYLPRVGEYILSRCVNKFEVTEVLHSYSVITYKLEKCTIDKYGEIDKKYHSIKDFRGLDENCIGCKHYQPVVEPGERYINCWCDNSNDNRCKEEIRNSEGCGLDRRNYESR